MISLSGASSFSGGVDFQAGTLAIGNNLALGTGLLNFNGGAVGVTIRSTDSTARTITSPLNFAGGAGANTIFGGTGNLKFTATPTANGTAKTLTVNNPQTELSGVLGGASSRTVAGTGVLILSGANTYSQGTIINSGATLQLGNGSVSGSLSTSGAIANDGTLRINHSDVVIQGTQFGGGPITGAGALVQAGSSLLLLNATNAFAGATIISSGMLGGTGSVAGSLNVQAAGTLAPGVAPVGALPAAIGSFKSGNAVIDGTAFMKLDRDAVTNCDQLIAPSVVVNTGATLTVTNLGSTNCLAGDKFTLFSTPITGTFGAVNLPPLPDAGLAWANNLTVDGSIAVVSVPVISSVPTDVVAQFSAGALTLSWPADHTGWRLQTQTNPVAAGLGAEWFDVDNSGNTNQVTVPVGTDAGAVFFRLVYP